MTIGSIITGILAFRKQRKPVSFGMANNVITSLSTTRPAVETALTILPSELVAMSRSTVPFHVKPATSMILVSILGNGDVHMRCECGQWRETISKDELKNVFGDIIVGHFLLYGLGHVHITHTRRASNDTVPNSVIPTDYHPPFPRG